MKNTQEEETCICGAREHSVVCGCGVRKIFTGLSLEQTHEIYRCECGTVHVVDLYGHEERRQKPNVSIMTVLVQTRDYLMQKIEALQASRAHEEPFAFEKMRQFDRQMRPQFAKLDIALDARDLEMTKVLCRQIIQAHKKHFGWK
jgi:hypothetical protein